MRLCAVNFRRRCRALQAGLLVCACRPKGCADGGASRAAIVFDVAIEARTSPTAPVRGRVVVNAGAGAEKTEKDVTRRPDHDSRVALPHDQIAGLRFGDALKSLDAVVKIVGARVGIRETGSFVDCVHQVGAIVAGIAADLGVERGGDDRQAVVGAKGAWRISRTISASACRRCSAGRTPTFGRCRTQAFRQEGRGRRPGGLRSGGTEGFSEDRPGEGSALRRKGD